MIHLNPSHPVCELAKIAFGYNGRLVAVDVSDHPFDFTSYWDSGCRDYHVLIRLSDRQVMAVPQNGSGFERQQIAPSTIQPGFAVVTRHCRGTRPDSITITVHPSTVASMALPAPQELSRDEMIVLCATRSYKSSYGGVSNYRFVEAQRETGITLESWSAAKASLIAKKLLNAAGAVTVEGKNVKTGNMWSYRPETQCA